MKNEGNNLLNQYAGLAMQLLVGLGLAAFAGIWIDKKINVGFPLLVWILPLGVLIIMILKAVKDTSSNK